MIDHATLQEFNPDVANASLGFGGRRRGALGFEDQQDPEGGEGPLEIEVFGASGADIPHLEATICAEGQRIMRVGAGLMLLADALTDASIGALPGQKFSANQAAIAMQLLGGTMIGTGLSLWQLGGCDDKF